VRGSLGRSNCRALTSTVAAVFVDPVAFSRRSFNVSTRAEDFDLGSHEDQPRCKGSCLRALGIHLKCDPRRRKMLREITASVGEDLILDIQIMRRSRALIRGCHRIDDR
jgi:hypothetical protein